MLGVGRGLSLALGEFKENDNTSMNLEGVMCWMRVKTLSTKRLLVTV